MGLGQMAVVHRNDRPYLYRSVRRGGRVTSEYLGSGQNALLVAAIEDDGRLWQGLDREIARSERKEPDDPEHAVDGPAEQARDLVCETVTAAGYHLHHRGEWGKRRVSRRGETAC
jgi:hypothetical protein